MKKKLAIIVLLFITILSLGSCHGRKSTPNFICPEEFDSSRDYNITFWAKNDSNPVQRRLYEMAISEFNKVYPNIHVEISHYSSYPDLYNAVIQNIGTNTTPNVAIAYPDHVATYLENPSLVVELDDLMHNSYYGLNGSKIAFTSPREVDFVSEYLVEGYIKIEGSLGLYTLPFMRSTECLYVNKTWLIDNGYQIPENNIFTWDYIWEICEGVLKYNSKMIPLIYKSSDNFFIELAYQNGYDYTNDDGDILFNNENNKQMVQKLNDLYKQNLFVTWQNTGYYPGDRFNTGQCIFGIDSSAGSTWMGPKAPLGASGLNDFEVLVTTIPQIDVSSPKVISQGPSLCLFNKEDPQEVLASWIFMQFLTTDYIQVEYAKTEGYSPVTKTAIESAEFQSFLASPDTYSVQRDAIINVMDFKSNTFITPAFNGSALVRDQVGKLIDSATQSKTRVIDIEALFQKAYNDSRS